ncbi:class I SAM-dependent methyltransferase [Leptospira sp. WS92.C1]
MDQKLVSPKESLYARLFARFYDRFMNRIETTTLFERRKQLIRPLKGKVLEIGSGTGINFPLYGSEADVLAIEPSSAMMDKAKEKITSFQSNSDHGTIRTELLGIGDPALESLVPPKSMDAVIFTLVLCTIPDPESAIRFAKSRLKKGGKVLILEHVRASSRAGRYLQNIINPLWTKFAQGCNLNRDPESILKSEGFRTVTEEHFQNTLPFYYAIYELI